MLSAVQITTICSFMPTSAGENGRGVSVDVEWRILCTTVAVRNEAGRSNINLAGQVNK